MDACRRWLLPPLPVNLRCHLPNERRDARPQKAAVPVSTENQTRCAPPASFSETSVTGAPLTRGAHSTVRAAPRSWSKEAAESCALQQGGAESGTVARRGAARPSQSAHGVRRAARIWRVGENLIFFTRRSMDDANRQPRTRFD